MAKDGIVRPSVKGMSNMGYLGHFAQDCYIQAGHNDTGDVLKLNERAVEREETQATDAKDTADEAAVAKAKADAMANQASDAQKQKDYENSDQGKADNYKNAPMADGSD